MATGLFGVSWTEIIDFLLKLAPAASIVGGILAARGTIEEQSADQCRNDSEEPLSRDAGRFSKK
jgi:hypothetical protein